MLFVIAPIFRIARVVLEFFFFLFCFLFLFLFLFCFVLFLFVFVLFFTDLYSPPCVTKWDPHSRISVHHLIVLIFRYIYM